MTMPLSIKTPTSKAPKLMPVTLPAPRAGGRTVVANNRVVKWCRLLFTAQFPGGGLPVNSCLKRREQQGCKCYRLHLHLSALITSVACRAASRSVLRRRIQISPIRFALGGIRTHVCRHFRTAILTTRRQEQIWWSWGESNPLPPHFPA